VVSAADAATISSVKALLMNRRGCVLSEAVHLFNSRPNDPAIHGTSPSEPASIGLNRPDGCRFVWIHSPDVEN
jgi:hypothetical protein